jgi:hypothetical protein
MKGHILELMRQKLKLMLLKNASPHPSESAPDDKHRHFVSVCQ